MKRTSSGKGGCFKWRINVGSVGVGALCLAHMGVTHATPLREPDDVSPSQPSSVPLEVKHEHSFWKRTLLLGHD
jgi:hypothetical protein